MTSSKRHKFKVGDYAVIVRTGEVVQIVNTHSAPLIWVTDGGNTWQVGNLELRHR
jgi:hypothetical protein